MRNCSIHCKYKYTALKQTKIIYSIAPFFVAQQVLWIPWLDIPSQNFFSRKFRMVCSRRGLTRHNHEIFITKINVHVIFNVFTKFWDYKIRSYTVHNESFCQLMYTRYGPLHHQDWFRTAATTLDIL